MLCPIGLCPVGLFLSIYKCLYRLSLPASVSICTILITYERKITTEQLHAAIGTLPDKQAKRIYAHYFMGMSKTAIAKAEGVSKATVAESINRALKGIEHYLKLFL